MMRCLPACASPRCWAAALVLLAQCAHAIDNANLVFNALQSSLRHWESSVNQNGMSLFVVTIPGGTPFYHGRHGLEIPTGLEWLAFTPEHASNFAAHIIFPPGRHPPGKHPPGRGDEDNHTRSDGEDLASSERQSQIPLPAAQDDPSAEKGYLYTYRTKRDLRFLYFDGMSASKWDSGSLDIQNYLLLNMTHNDTQGPDPPFPSLGKELEHVSALCAMIEDEWSSRLAGLIRTEGDFEIVMCSFAASLDLVRRVEVGWNTPRRGYPPIVGNPPGSGPPGQGHRPRTTSTTVSSSSTSSSFSAPATILAGQRNHDVAGSRAFIDFDNMVTAYAYPHDWPAANRDHRIIGWSPDQRARFRADAVAAVHRAITKPYGCEIGEAGVSWAGHDITGSAGRPVHWRSVGDLIVARYSSWLPSLLASDVAESVNRLLDELLGISAPFLDAADPNPRVETLRCAELYMPCPDTYKAPGASIAAQAVAQVSHHICETIVFAAHDLKAANDTVVQRGGLEAASLLEETRRDVVHRIENLITYLDWTTWKECNGCH